MLIIQHSDVLVQLLEQREKLIQGGCQYETELDYVNNLIVAHVATAAKNQNLL